MLRDGSTVNLRKSCTTATLTVIQPTSIGTFKNQIYDTHCASRDQKNETYNNIMEIMGIIGIMGIMV